MTSAIYTPYVYKELVDVGLGTKAMVLNAKRVSTVGNTMYNTSV